MQRVAVGVGVLIFRDNKILLGLRRGAHGANTWHPPGGHIEFGESPEQTAKREVLEETGLVVDEVAPGPWTNDVFVEDDKHYITVYMIANNVSGEPEVKEPHKCVEWRWFDVAELPQPLFLSFANLIKQHNLVDMSA